MDKEISDIITRATNPPKVIKNKSQLNIPVTDLLIVNDSFIKDIKDICKSNDNEILNASRCLLINLENTSGIIRMKSLYIISILFARSKLFRLEMSNNIRLIVSSAGLITSIDNNNNKNVLPKDYSKEVIDKIKEMIELWDIQFGHLYPQIRAIARYFRESIRIEMPNIKEKAIQHAIDIKIREENLRKFILGRRKKIINEIRDGIIDIKDNLNNLEKCFRILFPNVYDFYNDDIIENSVANINNSNMNNFNRKRTIWECDGVEVEVNDDDDDNNNDNDVIDNIVENNKIEEVIDWEDDDITSNTNVTLDRDLDREIDREIAMEDLTSAPVSIIINLSTSAIDIETAENKIILSTMKELKDHLENYSVPKLNEWQRVLSEAMRLYKEDRLNYSNTGNNNNNNNNNNNDLNNISEQIMLTENDLRQVAHLLSQIHSILRGRCKNLFG